MTLMCCEDLAFDVLMEHLVDQTPWQCLAVGRDALQNSKLFDYPEIRELNHCWFRELRQQVVIKYSPIRFAKKVLAQHWALLAAITAIANHRDHLTSHLRLALPESEVKDHWVRKYHQQLGRLRHRLHDCHPEVLVPSQNQLRGRIGGPFYYHTSNIVECHRDSYRVRMERSFWSWCTCTHRTYDSIPKIIILVILQEKTEMVLTS